MDKTGCKWICMFCIRVLILNLPGAFRKWPRHRISLLICHLGLHGGNSNAFCPLTSMTVNKASMNPTYGHLHRTDVWWGPSLSPGYENRPDWIPCSATKDVCNPGQAPYPHSIDEGAERLIPPGQLPAPGTAKFSISRSLVIFQTWTRINDRSGEMPEHSSFPSCTQRTEWTSASIPSPCSEIIHLWDRCVRSGREGDEFTLSPLNQRPRQLIYSALERVRVLLVENVLGTYKIYSNAINIVP